MDINDQAPFVARREILIQALPDAVWKVHSDISAWSGWHPDITKAELNGPLAIGSAFHWRAGGASLRSKLEVVDPNKQLAWTGKSVGVQARHVWTLTQQGNGTLVTTRESLDGWLARVLSLIMPKMLDKSLDAWLQGLKRRVEGTVATA
jgi:hypothetical protein